MFLFGFVVLATQPWHPAFLNPDDKGMLSPTTIFNTACSFLTNTNLQHYSGEVHLTYFSQLFVICWKQFVTPAIGLRALLAVIRGLRGDKHLGNYYLDLWRGLVYVVLPLRLIVGVLLIAGGVPMTLAGQRRGRRRSRPGRWGPNDDGTAEAAGRSPAGRSRRSSPSSNSAPTAAGSSAPNSAHPFENPTAWTNVVECVCIILIPMAVLVMFGRMLRNMRHAAVIFGVMLVLLGGADRLGRLLRHA